MQFVSFLGQLIAIIMSLLRLFSTLKELNLSDQKNNRLPAQEIKEKNTNTISDEKNNQNEQKNIEQNNLRKYELNILENKSYFYANCKNVKIFDSLSDDIKSIDSQEFKNYIESNDLCVKVTNKSEQSSATENKQKEENTQKIIESVLSREKEKNRLINKTFFLVNLYGNKQAFLMLPEEVQTLPPKEFEEYAKTNFKR